MEAWQIISIGLEVKRQDWSRENEREEGRRAVAFIVDKRREDSVTAKGRGCEELVSSLQPTVQGGREVMTESWVSLERRGVDKTIGGLVTAALSPSISPFTPTPTPPQILCL